jgi:hypothetical protein
VGRNANDNSATVYLKMRGDCDGWQVNGEKRDLIPSSIDKLVIGGEPIEALAERLAESTHKWWMGCLWPNPTHRTAVAIFYRL